MEPLKVLMVCLGNICRSPMADGLLRGKVKTLKLPIIVDSAGTANYHIGEKPHIRMIEVAAKEGFSIDDLQARQFSVSDFDKFDLIFAMDKENLNNINRLARNESDKQKVRLILNELLENKNSNLDVFDPYYGTIEDFQDCFDTLNKATDSIIENLKLKYEKLS